jgi:hypothetical protein
MFYQNDRIHYDKNQYIQSDVVNEKQINYNLYSNKSDEYKVKQVALKQPNIFYSDLNAITNIVDDNSNLLLNKKQLSKNVDREKLQEPNFYHKPYLGKGTGNTNVETMLRNGEEYHDKKFLTRANEKPGEIYKEMPLIDDVKSGLANPSKFVEENINDNWVRGGLPTRELSKY